MISKNKIKYIKSLELKKNRNKEGKFVAEGHKVVDDLLVLQPASLIVATEEWLKDKSIDPRTEVVTVSEEELRKVSFLQHPQQVLAVFDQRDNRDFASANIDFNCLNLALDGVQDPGNLGTIIRIADWFGIETIYCSPETADVYNPKVVQATMGSIARVKVLYGDLMALFASLPADVPVYGTLLDGEDITEMSVDERARAGLFLAMQYPVEIPGVTMSNFLRSAKTAVDGKAPSLRTWTKDVKEAMKNLEIDPDFIARNVNEGFSGGEKKRHEILQLELLKPKFGILDETDSGLDVDALKIVSEGVNRAHEANDMGVMLITHYTRILRYIKPQFVHVFVDGKMVDQGGPELADRLEEEGYVSYVGKK